MLLSGLKVQAGWHKFPNKAIIYDRPIMHCDLPLYSLKWYVAELEWTPSGC